MRTSSWLALMNLCFALLFVAFSPSRWVAALVLVVSILIVAVELARR